MKTVAMGRALARWLSLVTFSALWSSLAEAQNSPITLVQRSSKDAGTTTSSSLAFPANNTAANWIAVVVRAGRSNQAVTVSDTSRNNYLQAARLDVTVDAPLGDTLAIFYAQ